MNETLLYIASGMTCLWGISHLLATKGVVAGFGDLSIDNRRILTMEWIGEGTTLITLGALVAASAAAGISGAAAIAVYGVAVGALLVMAIVSLFTGARIAFLPYRLCPIIFLASAAMIGLGAWL